MGRTRQAMPIRVGMGMDRSAIAGYGKCAVRNKAALKSFWSRASKLKGISFPSRIRETRESVMEGRFSEAF